MREVKKFFLALFLVPQLLLYVSLGRPTMGYFGEHHLAATICLGVWLVVSFWTGCALLYTMKYFEIYLWIRWKKQWRNRVGGRHYFPETKEERAQLLQWAGEQLITLAAWASDTSAKLEKKRKELAALRVKLAHPNELLANRKARKKAEEECSMLTREAKMYFRKYHHGWDLFKDMGMLPEGYANPEAFRRAHEPKG